MKRAWLFATLVATAAPAAAQTPAPQGPPPVPSPAPQGPPPAHSPSPQLSRPPELLPATHWARRALWRLEAAALDDTRIDPAAGDLTAADAAAAFAAGLAGERATPAQKILIEEWQQRLDAEYPSAPTRLDLDLAAGAATHDDAMRTRVFWVNRDLGWEPPPAPPAPDTATATFAPRVAAALGGRAWLEVESRIAADDVAFRDAYAAGSLGTVGMWVGRRTTGYRTARGGGLVLDPRTAWDGVGLWLTDPVRLPSFLRHVGLIHLEGFLAVADSNGWAPRPWLLTTRLTVDPWPRFSVSVARGILFGAQNGSRKIDWEEMPRILVGYASEYVGDTLYHDNQVVAVDARWSPPLGAVPLQLYLTWGTEDTAGAWWDSPGIIGGILVPFVPGAPGLSLGVEHAVITSTGAHGSFYEHFKLIDGWTRDGALLGHALGGDGREWLLYGDVTTAGLDVQWKLLRRFRSRGNLLGRTGRSHGAELAGRYQLTGALDAEVTGFVEGGDGWTESALSAAFRLRWR